MKIVMVRCLVMLIASMVSICNVYADERSQGGLRSVAEDVRALGAYDAEFDVAAGEYRA